jgi:hypothetical protein
LSGYARICIEWNFGPLRSTTFSSRFPTTGLTTSICWGRFPNRRADVHAVDGGRETRPPERPLRGRFAAKNGVHFLCRKTLKNRVRTVS